MTLPIFPMKSKKNKNKKIARVSCIRNINLLFPFKSFKSSKARCSRENRSNFRERLQILLLKNAIRKNKFLRFRCYRNCCRFWYYRRNYLRPHERWNCGQRGAETNEPGGGIDASIPEAKHRKVRRLPTRKSFLACAENCILWRDGDVGHARSVVT